MIPVELPDAIITDTGLRISPQDASVPDEARAMINQTSGLLPELGDRRVVLWNTVYLERATQTLRESGKLADDGMLQFLSPLGWEHINLTGDYVWGQHIRVDEGR